VYYRYTDADDVLQGNAPRTIHQGVELALTFVPISRLRVDGNLSLADNHFVEFRGDSLGWGGWGGIADYSDRVIPAFPSLQAKGNVIWTHSLGETWLQVVYAGKQYIDFANTESAAIDPYALVHAGTRLDLPRIGPVKPILAVSVNNLLDTLYETFGYTYYDGWPPYRVDAYWPGATRSYFFEVKFQF
jgi:hypothetical protein